MAKTDLKILDMALPISSLEAYIQRVNQIPMLSQQEEQLLAERFFQHQDLEAARQLVIAHLRFVVKIARGYLGYGLALADLIQEGNMGLMKAIKRFDPSVGVRLVSFAVHWVKAEIQEYILRNWRIVKIATTKAQRKLFFNLRKAKQRLGWLTREETATVAEELGVSVEDVCEMENRLSAHDTSFDFSADEDDEQDFVKAPSAYLEDHRYEPTQQLELYDKLSQGRDQLQQALSSLDARSQQILQKRWLSEPKATLQELAECYQISAERVRQLESNALKKLKKELSSFSV